MILVIDNYDSFVHNLARYIERLGVATQVVRNDAITIADIERMQPQAIVLSPGPCTPDQAGCSLELVQAFYRRVPMLGICLGHQTIAQALGGRVVRGETPWHGRASKIQHNGDGVFAGLPSPLSVGRYHSLVVDPVSVPAELEPIAWTEGRSTVMALQHKELSVVGLQFHPESILTEGGYQLLESFLKIADIEDCQANSEELSRQEYVRPTDDWSVPDRPVTF